MRALPVGLSALGLSAMPGQQRAKLACCPVLAVLWRTTLLKSRRAGSAACVCMMRAGPWSRGLRRAVLRRTRLLLRQVTREAVAAVEADGIVFIDEIDKIVINHELRYGADASSEGVQRDLLPIIEGSVVSTKYGNVATDHILFICSGAFHSCKPSDMLAELQGRLPIRVELKGLTCAPFLFLDYQILCKLLAFACRLWTAELRLHGLVCVLNDRHRAVALEFCDLVTLGG